MSEHYKKLENLFLKSSINEILDAKIKITEGATEIHLTKKEFMHNEIEPIHSAYIFMVLESSAFFAANSLIEDVSIVSKSFEILYVRNLESKIYTAKAKFLEKSMGNYIISSELYDEKGNLITKAKGVYRRSKKSLKNIKNYV